MDDCMLLQRVELECFSEDINDSPWTAMSMFLLLEKLRKPFNTHYFAAIGVLKMKAKDLKTISSPFFTLCMHLLSHK